MIFVHVSDCSYDIKEYFACKPFMEIFVINDDIKKFPSWAKLSKNIDIAIVLDVLVHLHDVGMVLSKNILY